MEVFTSISSCYSDTWTIQYGRNKQEKVRNRSTIRRGEVSTPTNEDCG